MKKEEYPIVKKAWRIKVDDLVEPWHYEELVEYAETGNKAKSQFMGGSCVIDMYIGDYSDSREVEYKDIKVSRCKSEDIVLYKGNEINRGEVSSIEWMANRDAEALRIVNESPEAVCVVWAGCYSQYWGANHAGYTSLIERAGKYSAKEAYDIVMGSDYSRQESVIALDPQQFNSDIDVKIKNLEKDIENLKSCKV